MGGSEIGEIAAYGDFSTQFGVVPPLGFDLSSDEVCMRNALVQKVLLTS